MTAYEMRISDWSSDVCSSDLGALLRILEGFPACVGRVEFGLRLCDDRVVCVDRCAVALVEGRVVHRRGQLGDPHFQRFDARRELFEFARLLETELALVFRGRGSGRGFGRRLRRSEEHTSELQSLMRISYAVFGLKNKN